MKKLKMGMVGGGSGALIGAVHRRAAIMDGEVEFVAGALSSNREKALASGRELGLTDERNYASWERMLEDELSLQEKERIDFVSIVTPNHMHHPVARAFAEAGFNVVLDKPMVHTSQEAEDLMRVVESSGVVFAVTYTYTGYPMVKQARHMVREGLLGEVQEGDSRVQPGLARQPAGGERDQAGRVANRPGPLGDSGGHRRHRLPRREPRLDHNWP